MKNRRVRAQLIDIEDHFRQLIDYRCEIFRGIPSELKYNLIYWTYLFETPAGALGFVFPFRYAGPEGIESILNKVHSHAGTR